MAQIEWDENKRLSNLRKHGFDFVDANLVLQSPFRLDLDSAHDGEQRVQSFAYIFERLAVLTVAHTKRGEATRIISFRRASKKERENYHEWLANSF